MSLNNIKSLWVVLCFFDFSLQAADLDLSSVSSAMFYGDRSGNNNNSYGYRIKERSHGFDNYRDYGNYNNVANYGGYGNYDGYGYGGLANYGNYGPRTNLFGAGYEYGNTAQPLYGLVNGYMGSNRGYAQGGEYGRGLDTYRPNQGLSIRYGDGGFGDKNVANFNLKACVYANQKDCTAQPPGTGEYEWRYIDKIGWRKMETYGAARKDWWDFKKSVPLPFNYFNFPRF